MRKTAIALCIVISSFTISQAQPLFYKEGMYMGTEAGFYSKQRLSGTNDAKKYPGFYGGYIFGVNPVFGFLSGVIDGDDPYLTIGDVLIADAATVRADFGGWPAPYNIMFGFMGEYTLSLQFGKDEDDFIIMAGPRYVASNYGPAEPSAVVGFGYFGYTVRLTGSAVDLTVPLSKEKESATWLFLHYHSIKNDANLQFDQNAGVSLMAGMGFQW